jgi:hypothetical protein
MDKPTTALARTMALRCADIRRTLSKAVFNELKDDGHGDEASVSNAGLRASQIGPERSDAPAVSKSCVQWAPCGAHLRPVGYAIMQLQAEELVTRRVHVASDESEAQVGGRAGGSWREVPPGSSCPYESHPFKLRQSRKSTLFRSMSIRSAKIDPADNRKIKLSYERSNCLKACV